MAYGIQNLRRSAVFDQLTPGRSGGGTSDIDDRGSFEQSRSQSNVNPYDPYEGRTQPKSTNPYDPYQEVPPPPGLAKLADLSVDPNKGADESNTRLKRMIDTIQGSYQPETYSRDRNDRLLDNPPTRGQPTKMDRFTAMMVGLGSKNPIEDQEKILQSKYYQDADEFKMRADPYYKAAQLENTANTQERQIVGNAISGFSAAERNAETARNNDLRYQTAQQKLEIDRFKADNPNWIIKTDGPNVMGYDPQDPNRSVNLGPSGNLSDAEKLRIQGQTARDVATIGANARISTAGASGSRGSSEWYRDQAGGQFRFNGSQIVDVSGNPYTPQGQFNKIPTESTNRGDGDGGDSPSAQATALKNRMIDVYNRVPGARAVLVPNPNGTYTPRERPERKTGWRDNSEELANYDKIMKAIYPDYVSPDGPAPTPQGGGLPNGPIAPGGPGDGTLRARAADALAKAGKPVTQANIDWMIQNGRVR